MSSDNRSLYVITQLSQNAWEPQGTEIRIYDTTTQLLTKRFATGVEGAEGIAVDNKGFAYFTVTGSSPQVRKATPESDGSYKLETIIASGLGEPTGITIDESGNILVADKAKGAMNFSPDGKLRYTFLETMLLSQTLSPSTARRSIFQRLIRYSDTIRLIRPPGQAIQILLTLCLSALLHCVVSRQP